MSQHLAPEINLLSKEMQSLKSLTSQLGRLANDLANDQQQLNQSQQKQLKVQEDIRRAKIERQTASQRKDNNFVSLLDTKLVNLEQNDLPGINTSISKKEAEIRDLQGKQQQLQAQRHQQLINTFHSLDTALNSVVQQPDYFTKYILLVHLRDDIGIQQLDGKEFPSFTDQKAVKELFDKFEKELSSSKQLLTEQDKKDISDVPQLNDQIAKDEQTLVNMERTLEKENSRAIALKQKLNKVTVMQGYPPQKLSTFLIAGLVAIAIGVLFVVLGFPKTQNGGQAIAGFLLSGIALIIAGAVLLWLRYSNDKEKRLPEVKNKLEIATTQFSQHNNVFQSLQQKVAQEKDRLSVIYQRRPILQTMNGPSI